MSRPLAVLLALVGQLAMAHPGAAAELARLDSALLANPDDVQLRLDRAATLRRLGDYPAALSDLMAVKRVVPENRRLLLERARLFLDIGQLEQAERDLDFFLASGRPSVTALQTRARLRAQTGRAQAAIEDYSAAISLRPDPDLYLERGKLQEEAGALAQAARGYADGLRRLGGAISLREALIRVERARGQHRQALALIDALLPKLPVKADWYLLRAELHEEAGQPKAARSDRLRAVRELDALLLERPTALWLVSRAKAHASLGRPEQARGDLERALRASPSLEEARLLLERLPRRPEPLAPPPASR